MRAAFFPLTITILPPHNSTLFPYTTLFRSPDQHCERMLGLGDLQPSFAPLRALIRRFGEELLVALLERSEEHTSELQSPCNLVCRLLLEKKKHITITKISY